MVAKSVVPVTMFPRPGSDQKVWRNSTTIPWLAWKSNTSSDEIGGHVDFELLFRELVAAQGAEQDRVLQHVTELMTYCRLRSTLIRPRRTDASRALLSGPLRIVHFPVVCYVLLISRVRFLCLPVTLRS